MNKTQSRLTQCLLSALMSVYPALHAGDHWLGNDYAESHSVQHQWAGHLLGDHPFRGDEEILDVGCGDGSLSAEMAAAIPGGSIVALDASPSMIAHANATHGAVPNLNFVEGDAAQLEFDQQFDLVTCFACLQWVKDQQGALSGIYRILKPGGRMLITFPMEGMLTDAIAHTRNSPRWKGYFSNYVPKTTSYTTAQYDTLLRTAGFIDCQVEDHLTATWMESPAAMGRWMSKWLDEQYQVPESEREAFVTDIVSHYLTNQVRRDGKFGVRLEVFMASALKPQTGS